MPQVPQARYLLRAKDLVDARYAEAITVDDLATAAGLSRAHFSRMFTRTFGESPLSYLQTRRLERAAAPDLLVAAQGGITKRGTRRRCGIVAR